MIDLEEISDDLAKLLIRPPNAEMAIRMIVVTEMMHMAAISGLLHNTVHCQESLDAAYSLVENSLYDFKNRIHGILKILAKSNNLTAKDEPTSHNEQVAKDILKEMNGK